MNRVPIQDAHISFMQGYFFVVYKLRHFSIIYINKFYDRVNSNFLIAVFGHFV